MPIFKSDVNPKLIQTYKELKSRLIELKAQIEVLESEDT